MDEQVLHVLKSIHSALDKIDDRLTVLESRNEMEIKEIGEELSDIDLFIYNHTEWNKD